MQFERLFVLRSSAELEALYTHEWKNGLNQSVCGAACYSSGFIYSEHVDHFVLTFDKKTATAAF